jgi:hypothetical protein
MAYGVGNPGPGFGRAQKCARVKPVNRIPIPTLPLFMGFPFPLFPSLWDSQSHSSLLYGIPIPTLPLMGFPFPLFPSLWDSHSHSSLLYWIPIPTLPFFMGFSFPFFPSLWDSHSHSSLDGIPIPTLPFFMGFSFPLFP